MTPLNPNIEMVELVAKGLGVLLKDFCFIGGATTSLYLDKPSEFVRPTKDVDCVVTIATYLEQQRLERQLEKLGFEHCTDPGAPICRWIFQGIRVDVMPSNAKVLGFTNHWFEEGIKNSVRVTLPSGQEISIFSIPYFMAAKLDAFKDRGRGDFYASADLEDIVTVIDGCSDIRKKVMQAPSEVKDFLKKEMKILETDERFQQCISGHLVPGPNLEERARGVLDFLLNIP